MPYQPIEDYGIIGNMRTVALVGMNGSIDWHCSPNFDSPSIFGAILHDAKGGHFQIAPIAHQVRRKQFYWPSTNILVTRFSHENGIVELEDFMPVGFSSDADSPFYHQLHRRVRCVRGPVRLSAVCRRAFDYGRQSHQVQIVDGGASFRGNNTHFRLTTDVPLQLDSPGGVTAEFVLEEGQSKTFVFQYDGQTMPPPNIGLFVADCRFGNESWARRRTPDSSAYCPLVEDHLRKVRPSDLPQAPSAAVH